VTACRLMSRCSHNWVNVCPLLLRNSSSSLRRLPSANALNTASTILNMQPCGCIFKGKRCYALVFAAPERKISQSFNPQPSYLPPLPGSGLAMRTSGGEASALVLGKTCGPCSCIPSSRLEQEGQTPGWREKTLPGKTGSPQQIQA